MDIALSCRKWRDSQYAIISNEQSKKGDICSTSLPSKVTTYQVVSMNIILRRRTFSRPRLQTASPLFVSLILRIILLVLRWAVMTPFICTTPAGPLPELQVPRENYANLISPFQLQFPSSQVYQSPRTHGLRTSHTKSVRMSMVVLFLRHKSSDSISCH